MAIFVSLSGPSMFKTNVGYCTIKTNCSWKTNTTSDVGLEYLTVGGHSPKKNKK